YEKPLFAVGEADRGFFNVEDRYQSNRFVKSVNEGRNKCISGYMKTKFNWGFISLYFYCLLSTMNCSCFYSSYILSLSIEKVIIEYKVLFSWLYMVMDSSYKP